MQIKTVILSNVLFCSVSALHDSVPLTSTAVDSSTMDITVTLPDITSFDCTVNPVTVNFIKHTAEASGRADRSNKFEEMYPRLGGQLKVGSAPPWTAVDVSLSTICRDADLLFFTAWGVSAKGGMSLDFNGYFHQERYNDYDKNEYDIFSCCHTSLNCSN